jgi:RNA polymerase sigma-70 factor (ECF subfamily)
MKHLSQQTSLVHGLFVQNMMAVRGYVLALMPDFSRVDDIVQETFITATEKAAEFQEGTNFKAWIFAIARFKVLEALRDPSCARLSLAPEVIEALSAEDGCESRMDDYIEALSGCIERLAPRAHRVIELRYQQAHRPPEVARLMGWTLNSVNVALARARSALRSCIEAALKQKPA